MPFQLVDTVTALQTAGSSTIGDNVLHMERVLQASAPLVENLIGTTLQEAKRIDWFSYRPSFFVLKNFREEKFLLEQGFVDVTGTTPFSLYESNDGLPVKQDFSNGDLLVNGEDYILAEEPGEFTILKTVSTGIGSLALSYSAGFREEQGVLVDLPEWLRTTAISAGIRWQLANQHKWNNKERVDLTPEVVSIFRQHLNEHIRTRYGVHPLRSIVVP